MVPLIQILVLCDSKSKAETASRLIRFHAGTHKNRVFIPFITGGLPEDHPQQQSGNALTTEEAMVTLNAVNVVVYDHMYYETANVESRDPKNSLTPS